jgi:phosphoribosylformylglycinamidine synthase
LRLPITCACSPRPAARSPSITRNNRPVLSAKRDHLQRTWSETTWRMQTLRDDPDCAREEYDRIIEPNDPGLSVHLTFKPESAALSTSRPRVAILREQGVNGQVEMAAACDRAGFEAVDVHMTDLISGRTSLEGFKAFIAGGGFSYGDVLGGGQGWAKTILFNKRAREQFERFFARQDTFAFGACNGCQMMGALREIVPGAGGWPLFVRNRSEQFEARLVMVEITKSPSILFAGMEGSRIPIATAHGEGRALFEKQTDALVCMRYVNNRGEPTDAYPYNPSGSPGGITGLTTADGRFTIVMPHPERVFRTVQMSWAPPGLGEDSPWMRLFYNARRWVG